MQDQCLLKQGRWQSVGAVRPTLSLAYFLILIWALKKLCFRTVCTSVGKIQNDWTVKCMKMTWKQI
jgi:hypothetical protein